MTSWWAKALMAVLAVGLAVASGINALANHWRITGPETTLAWRHDDAVALSMLEDRRLADVDVTAVDAASAAALGRRALRSDPLTAPALRQIAMAEAVERRPDRARMLVLLAHRISRRELGVLTWLIQDSLNRGEVAPVVGYFDEAMLTNPVAADQMYPALSAGLFDRALRAGLVPLLREDRPWMPGFLHYAATTGGGARYVAAIVIAAGGLPPKDGYIGLNSQVLASLAGRQDFALARAYLRRVNGTGRDISVDPRFTAVTIGNDLGPFSWRLTDGQDLAARRGEQNDLQVRTGPDQRGTVAQRVLMLPPGRYLFTQSVAVPANVPPANARWEWQCLPALPGGLLWAQDLPAGSTEVSSRIDIPASCVAQKLVLTASNPNDEDEAQIIVERLALRRP